MPFMTPTVEIIQESITTPVYENYLSGTPIGPLFGNDGCFLTTGRGALTALHNNSDTSVTIGTVAESNNVIIAPGSRLFINTTELPSATTTDKSITFTVTHQGVISTDFSATAATMATTIDPVAWEVAYSGMSEGEVVRDRFKRQIKRNLLIRTKTRSKIVNIPVTPAELKARQTLRDFITEKEWRRYITNGFIMVAGESGWYYQIWANRSHTIVWEKNKKIQELCIRTDDSCPPTDHVLTIKALVELDEEAVWDGANQYSANNDKSPEAFIVRFNSLVAV